MARHRSLKPGRSPADMNLMKLHHLKIGPRLVLGFFAVLALCAAVVGMLAVKIEGLKDSNLQLVQLQRRAALAADWKWQTQINATRTLALLKSGSNPDIDAYFTPQIKAASERISAVQKQLTELVDSDQGKALLKGIGARREAYIAARNEILAALKASQLDQAQSLLATKMEPAVAAYIGSLQELADFQTARVDGLVVAIAAEARHAEVLGATLFVGTLLLGALLAYGITRSITRPLAQTVAAAERIRAGDLTQPLHAEGRDEVADLQRSLAGMQDALRLTVGRVVASSDSIRNASTEIASGNQDLSARTEQTAGNLQQAASAIEELSGTLNQTADSARTANQLASSASEVARRGGEVVSQVVSTMDEINASSKRIGDIIGVIDGIAFQTNILALNAAVEAARAGEQGRGFAVVAAEVRSLAQRSAAAAREIKSLIGASVEKVESGARLVQDAGSTMTEIVASVQRVSDIIGEISAAAGEQSHGIGQVNGTVTQLDQATQQNAALVEESAAAAESLKEQARQLAEVVATFRLEAGAEAAPAVAAAPRAPVVSAPSRDKPAAKPAAKAVSAPRPSARAPAPAPTPAPTPAPAAAGHDGDWETF